MTTLSKKDFLVYLERWVIENSAEISRMWPTKGGWELNAQPAITSYLLDVNSTFDILREQSVFVSRRKSVDFLLNFNSNNSKNIVVELKCQSFENRDDFIPGLLRDQNKLLTELSSQFIDCEILQVGLHFNLSDGLSNHFNNKVINSEIGMCWSSPIIIN